MSTLYPVDYDVFTQKQDVVPGQETTTGDIVHAEHINSVQESILSIERTLGRNPQGVNTTVSERISNVEGSKALRTPSLCIFFGDPLSYNGATSVSQAAGELKYFDNIVFGEGLENPSDPNHESFALLINEILDGRNTNIFGCIDAGVSTSNYTLEQIELRVFRWKELGATGIFLNNFGYDCQVSRVRQNNIIDIIHRNRMTAFIRATEVTDVFESVYDEDYNPGYINPLVGSGDIYLHENLGVDTSLENPYVDSFALAQRLTGYRSTLGIKIYGLASIGYEITTAQEYFDYAQAIAILYSYDAFYATTESFGVPYNAQLLYRNLSIVGDYYDKVPYVVNDPIDTYYRIGNFGKITIVNSDHSYTFDGISVPGYGIYGTINTPALVNSVIEAINNNPSDVIDPEKVAPLLIDHIKEIVIDAINDSINDNLVISSARIGDISADKITSGYIATERLIANVVSAINAYVNTLTTEEIDAGVISADAMRANVISAINANIDDATINFAKIGGVVIGTALIENGSITTAKIADLAVTTAKIADISINTAKIEDLAVTTSKIDNLAVTTGKIADATITTAKIQDAQITTAKIANASITNAKIGEAEITSSKIGHAEVKTINIDVGAVDTIHVRDASITSAKIAEASIQTAHINDASITSAKIGHEEVLESNIGNLAVTTAKIADTSITTAKIEDAAITNAKIGELAVDSANINNLAVTTAKIADAAVTDAKIQNLNASKITAGTIDANVINGSVITAINITSETARINGALIQDATIGNAKITSIDAGKITTGSIGTDMLSANVIEAINLHSGSAVISQAKIDNISASKITSGTIDTSKVTISTNTVGSRLEFNTDGIFVIDSSESIVAKISSTDGIVIHSDAGLKIDGGGSIRLGPTEDIVIDTDGIKAKANTDTYTNFFDAHGIRTIDPIDSDKQLILRSGELKLTTDGGHTFSTAITTEGIYGHLLTDDSVTHDKFDKTPPEIPSWRGNGVESVLEQTANTTIVSIIIKWEEVQDSDLQGYNIYLDEGDTGSFYPVASVGKTNEYKVKAVKPNTTFAIKVTSFDTQGNECNISTPPDSNKTTYKRVITSAKDTIAPQQVSKPQIVRGAKMFAIRWDAVTTNEDGSNCYDLNYYEVQRASSIDGFGSWNLIGNINGTFAIDKDVEYTYSYRYRIIAVDTSGNKSLPSQAVDAGYPDKIGEADIVAHSITSDHIAVTGLDASIITSGRIHGDFIEAETITADKFESTLYGDIVEALRYVRGQLTGLVYSWISSEANWNTGTFINTVNIDGALMLDTVHHWDTDNTWGEQGLAWDYPVIQNGSWESPIIDLVETVTLFNMYKMNATNVSTNSTITILSRYSEDNITWTEYEELRSRIVTCRYVQFKIDISVETPNSNIRINSFEFQFYDDTKSILSNSTANIINTTGSGNIVNFTVNDVIRAVIDNSGKYTGTIDWDNINSKPFDSIGTDFVNDDGVLKIEGNESYIHDQIASSKTWVIDHNLNKYPSVSVVDSAGNFVMGDVNYVSTTRVIVEFSSPFSGKVYLN